MVNEIPVRAAVVGHTVGMRSITVSDASSNFSALIDAVERGEHVIITREDRPIAAVAPARPHTGADLRAALAVTEPPDERFEHGIEAAMGLVVDDVGIPGCGTAGVGTPGIDTPEVGTPAGGASEGGVPRVEESRFEGARVGGPYVRVPRGDA